MNPVWRAIITMSLILMVGLAILNSSDNMSESTAGNFITTKIKQADGYVSNLLGTFN